MRFQVAHLIALAPKWVKCGQEARPSIANPPEWRVLASLHLRAGDRHRYLHVGVAVVPPCEEVAFQLSNTPDAHRMAFGELATLPRRRETRLGKVCEIYLTSPERCGPASSSARGSRPSVLRETPQGASQGIVGGRGSSSVVPAGYVATHRWALRALRLFSSACIRVGSVCTRSKRTQMRRDV